MNSGLSEQEIAHFASLFHRPEHVRRILLLAGLPPANQPVWREGSAQDYWREISFLLSAGILVGGRNSLFTAADQLTRSAAPGAVGPTSVPTEVTAEAGFPGVAVYNSIGVMITHGGTMINDFRGAEMPAERPVDPGARTGIASSAPTSLIGGRTRTGGGAGSRLSFGRWLSTFGRRADQSCRPRRSR
ncbi:effector-associated domain EAD1-containing protein [Frankia sp. Ag45/Mut15]|uniref:Effector-associated domain EAD1-containing protein n=1 Tax=Frankia umida TaxID=573489 RepID=A0ABT0JZ40_9ACTN|nr:effector-associated domain EAD1-containing protein [Frankia umida]MCK9876811.1 effector-associated domain EAD1-containing protein [Frankia umida]